MSITGTGAGYRFGYDPWRASAIEDFIPKESPVTGVASASLFKAGDAIAMDSSGNAKKVSPGDPVIGYVLPEGASKRPGKALVQILMKAPPAPAIPDIFKKDMAEVFNNASLSDSEIQLSKQMKADLLKATEVSRKAREEYNRELPPSLNGYRPTCCLCRKPVDRFLYERLPQFRSFRFQAQCHGRTEQMDIPDDMYGYRGKTTMFDIIEQRGFFRSDAEEARMRDNYPPQYVRDKYGNATAVRYPNIAEVDYDGPKFSTERVRAIEEKMQAQYRDMVAAMSPTLTSGLIGTPSSASIDNRYTTSGSASPPKKPTKAELLKMLAEIEKEERPSAEIALDAERVITL